MGVAAFSYLHLDALDGKQARRTGTSSPLGQLVDHGCDCINLTFMVFMFWSVFGMEASALFPLYASLCFAVFIASTWEEFHTGVLYLGRINGPVEGTTSLSVCSIISGVLGRHVWSSVVFGGYRIKDLLLFFIVSGSVLTIACSVLKVLRVKGVSAMHDLLPSFAALYCGCWWLSQREGISPGTLSLFLAMIGLMTSNLVSRIVVNHVTHQPYPRWTAAFLPVIIGCLTAILREHFSFLFFGVSDQALLAAGYLWVIAMQVHYHVVIFDTVSSFLGIRVFKIAPQAAKIDAAPPKDTSKSHKDTFKLQKAKPRMSNENSSSPTKELKVAHKSSAMHDKPFNTDRARKKAATAERATHAVDTVRQSPRTKPS